MIKTYFTMNLEGQLEINVPEVLNTPQYKILFDRDKFSPGDSNGRKKLIAKGEMYYIYLICDVRSSIYNLPLSERKIKAKEIAKLPDKWTEDNILEEAIEQYKKDFKLSSAGKAYVAAEANYYSLAEDTEYLSEEVIALKTLAREKAKKLKARNIGEGEFATTAKELLAIVEQATTIQKKIMTNITEFTKQDKIVKELANKFIESGGSIRIPVGNRELGNREE